MTTNIFIELPTDVQAALWEHLLMPDADAEQVAFVFGKQEGARDSTVFRFAEWYLIPPEGFASRSECHLELSDKARAFVIKRAHDLGASLVEFHSHAGPWPAGFSPSDLVGLREFVPHVWWRLKGKPYAAVVLSRSGQDGLVWLNDPHIPQRLTGLLVGNEVLPMTNITDLSTYKEGYE